MERRAATDGADVGTTVNLPAAVAVPNSYVVAAVVHYAYTPAIGYVLTGTFDLNSTYYLRPRLSDCVMRVPATHPVLSGRSAGAGRMAGAGDQSPSITA